MRVVADVVLTVRGHRHRFQRVPHERCARCQERIFGIDASLLFDAAVLPRRRRRAA